MVLALGWCMTTEDMVTIATLWALYYIAGVVIVVMKVHAHICVHV